MAKHIVEIQLNEDEERVIKYLAKQGGRTVKQELSTTLYSAIWHIMELYGKEAE